MRYPALIIDREKVHANACEVVRRCEAHRGEPMAIWGVTKGMAGSVEIAKIYERAGLAGVADSRLANLKRIKEAGVALPRMLIRIPMPSELEELPHIADWSMASDLSSIERLDAICREKGIAHHILIAIDEGDLREGFWPDELPDAGAKLAKMTEKNDGVTIAGVATNFGCASGVLPTRENLRAFVEHRDMLSESLGCALPHISVGGSCCLKAMEDGAFPAEIDHFRMGESILLGEDTNNGRFIPYLASDTMELLAEVVEVRRKPSVPVGKVGADAFGNVPTFVDRGVRIRALLGLGKQDVSIEALTCIDQNVEIVTASSDHMIVDVTARGVETSAGDILRFRPAYPAMLALATSAYVDVHFE